MVYLLRDANPYIIAEAGINHNGDVALAKQLIDAAVQSGADAIKFQTFDVDALLKKDAEKAGYQQQEGPEGETQYDMLKQSSLSADAFSMLAQYAADRSIDFLSTPFDLPSLQILEALDLPLYKVSSGDITNYFLLEALGALNKPLLLSTGMATLVEIQEALDVLQDAGTHRVHITLLHCVSAYPCPHDEANVRAVDTLAKTFDVAVGYSDHTLGIEAPIVALGFGASVIEKHLTLDKSLPGPDHQCSLDGDEFKAMVTSLRQAALTLGTGKKVPTPSERENMGVARKSLVATKAIKKGDTLSSAQLGAIRPGQHLSPMRARQLIGQPSAYDYAEGDWIKEQ